MISEYAVEPETIGESWSTFRYLIEQFGVDRGRMISRFPRDWFRMVIASAKHLPEIERRKIEVRLEQAKRRSILDRRRPNGVARTWIENATTEHSREPFRGIVSRHNPGNDQFVVSLDDWEEEHPISVAPREVKIDRDPESLAKAAMMLLQNSRVIMFVDGYFDPSDRRYQRSIRAWLETLRGNQNRLPLCEIHYVERRGTPPADAIEREARHWFRPMIPNGMVVTLYRWRRKAGGEEFHARYILTDCGGLRIDEGLAVGQPGERTDISLMDIAFVESRRRALDRDADVFELVEPVLQIASNGYVEEV